MSKLEFALKSSLVLAIVSHEFVTAQTKTPTQRETTSVQEARRSDVQGGQAETPSQGVEHYKEYDFGLEPSPEEAKKFYKQGVTYGRMKLFTEAVAAFELAILLKPNYTDAYFGLGHAYFDLGRWKEAIQAFRRVIELDPEDTEAYVRLHQINERLAREDKTTPLGRPGVQTNIPSADKVSLTNRSITSKATEARSTLNKAVSNSAPNGPMTPNGAKNSVPSVELNKNSQVVPRTLTNSRTETAVKSSPVNSLPKPGPESRISFHVSSTPESNRSAAPPTAKIKVVRNPMLPQSSLKLVLSLRIARDPGVIPKPLKNSATTVPVNVDAPLPSTSSHLGGAAAAKPGNAEIYKTTAYKNENLSDSTVPASPPKDAAATVGTSKSSSNVTSGSPVPEPMSEVGIYRVGIGDVLEVRVADAPVNSPTLFTVSAGGLLDYPVLNQPLPVLGLTPDEIGEKLKNELRRRALTEAEQVVVGVRDYNSHTILVGGLVNEQGTKVLRREAIPLYVVLAEAEPHPEAGRVAVISQAGSKTTYVDLANPDANALLIHPGDVVLVQAKPKLFFYIGGEVKEPGEKPFRQDLKLTQAILKAGGLTRVSKAAELAREGANGLLEVTVYKLSDINSGKLPDPIIQPGDRITIVH